MTRFSARYAVLLGVLLALALGLTIHGRLAPHRDECPSNEALLDAQAIDLHTSLRLEGERSTRIEAGSVSGLLPATSGGDAELPLAILRSFGLPNRLLQPAESLPGRHEPDEVQESVLETPAGPLPVRYAYERRGRSIRVTGYFMTYRGRIIESPLWVRLVHGPEAAFAGSFPITLFAIAAETHANGLASSLEQMNAWLRAAWLHYRRVCGS